MLLYYDPAFLQHQTGDHPECGERLIPAARRLNLIAMQLGCPRPNWKPAAREVLELVHTPAYLDFLQQTCAEGGGQLDPDTVVSPRSYDVACLAAGAVVDAVERVLRGEERRAFCLIRPPGHHALADRAMGFCLLNHVAIAARFALSAGRLERVLIIDWDVHHGNGTQDLFWQEPRVGFFSIHRAAFYPGSGAETETGEGAAAGTKLNLPIPFGTPRAEYLEHFRDGLAQLASRVEPQLVLISAGFDAHRLDPVGGLGLEAEDFATMTREVVRWAARFAGGRIVSLLEGGYHPEAVADGVEAHVQELLATG